MIVMSTTAFQARAEASSTGQITEESSQLYYRGVSVPAVANVTHSLAAVSWDGSIGAAYLRLKPGDVTETLEVKAQVLLDIGKQGEALGIELLLTERKAVRALEKSLGRLPDIPL